MTKQFADKAPGCISAAKFSPKEIALLEAKVKELNEANDFDDQNHAYIEAAMQMASEAADMKSIIEAALAKDDAITKGADPRALKALGSGAPLKAVDLGTQLYQLVDAGKAAEADVDDQLNSLTEAKPKYAAVQAFIEERRNAKPDVAGAAGVAPGAVPSGGADAAGSRGNLGRVAPDAGGGVPGAGPAPVAGTAATESVGDGAGRGGAGALTADKAIQFLEAFQALTGRTKEVVKRWLGVDDQLEVVDDPESLAAIGATLANEKTGEVGVTKQAVHKIVVGFLRSVGMPEDISADAVRDRFHLEGSGADVAVANSQARRGEDTTSRLSEEVDADETTAEIERADTDEVASSRDAESANAADLGEGADRAGAEEAAAEDTRVSELRPENAVDAAKAGKTLDQLLADDIRRGKIMATDVRDAAETWEETRLESDRAWDDLRPTTQAAWVRHFAYTEGRTTAETQEKLLEQDNPVPGTVAAGTRKADAVGTGRAAEGAAPAGVPAKAAGSGDQVRPAEPNAPAKVGEVRRVKKADAAAPKPAAVVATKTPAEEAWTALQAKTPAMPAWADLDKKQQSRVADLVTREKFNLAAAQQVAGDTAGGTVKLESEEDGEVTVGAEELTGSSKAELLAMPGAKQTLADMSRLGLSHLFSWVDVYATAPDVSAAGENVANGWVVGAMSPTGKAETMLVLREGMDDRFRRFTLAHELGHVGDMAPFGGVFSSQTEMRPGGEVWEELSDLYDTGNETWEGILSYPFDPKYDVPTQAGELFAQMFAMYANPAGRTRMEIQAPLTHQFIEKAINALRLQTNPTRHYQQEVSSRRSAFTRQTGAQGGKPSDLAGRVGARGQGAGGSGSAVQGVNRSERGNRAVDALAALEAEKTAAGRIAKAMEPTAKAAFTNARDTFKKIGPWLLTNLQLAKEFGDKITTLKNHVGLSDLMRQERTRMQMEFNAVAVAWDKLPKDVKGSLSKVMQTATMREMHPDLKFDDELNAHLARKDDKATEAKLRAEHAALAREYAALSPAAKKVYQDAKNTLEKSWQERAAAYKRVVDSTYSESIAEAMEAGDTDRVDELRKQGVAAEKDYDNRLSSIKGPYFPLMRFGEYLAVGESSELKSAKDALIGATGKALETAKAELDKLKRDEKHYVMSAHETRAAAEAAAKKYEAAGLTARTDLGDLKLDGVQSVTQSTISHLTDAVRNKIGGAEANVLRDSLMDVFLKGLPEIHALRREAERKGIAGAETDMMRAFSAAGNSNAFYASRLMYAKEMADNMFQMKREVKGNIDLGHVHREMQQRVALDMRFNRTPLQDLASTVSWVYHLGVSPSFILMNSTQPWLVSVPVLAAKFGVGRSTKAMADASRDAIAVLRDARWKDGKWDAWSGISEDSIPGESRNEDRAAIRKLLQRGVVDEGIQHELNVYAADSSRWLSKAQRWMGWATQQVEVVNRLATALAAFRLARKNGMSEAEAIDYAYDLTTSTQMDYSQEGTARFMRDGGGVPMARLVFQFRRYQQGMLYLLGSNLKKLALSPKERKEAAATLGYLSIATGMVAGTMGLPLLGVGLAVADMFIDDDDERGNAEVQLRNLLVDLTGDKDTADVLAKGLPAMWDMDFSKRLGLADIASPFPMARFDQAKTGNDAVGETLRNIAGPAAGVAASWYDATKYFGQGDFAKGVEKMSPKFVADVSKAARFSTEGMTDAKGELILGPDQLDAWDILYRGLGVAPTIESNYYEGTKALKGTEQAVKDRKTRISNKFMSIVSTGSGDMSKLREEIDAFNEAHPNERIMPKDEISWRRKAQTALRERDESGIRVAKRDKNYEDVMRFARP